MEKGVFLSLWLSQIHGMAFSKYLFRAEWNTLYWNTLEGEAVLVPKKSDKLKTTMVFFSTSYPPSPSSSNISTCAEVCSP